MTAAQAGPEVAADESDDDDTQDGQGDLAGLGHGKFLGLEGRGFVGIDRGSDLRHP
jgi:hypothetical protein